MTARESAFAKIRFVEAGQEYAAQHAKCAECHSPTHEPCNFVNRLNVLAADVLQAATKLPEENRHG